jgi:uncharacterized protein (DUF952 family)
VTMIYHLATLTDWQRAQATGEYTTSTRGKTLAQEGFIHASTASQITLVANAVYTGDQGLVVLAIEEARLKHTVVYEPVPGWDDPFPHIYGPLNIDAVVQTIPLVAGQDGSFRFEASKDREREFPSESEAISER